MKTKTLLACSLLCVALPALAEIPLEAVRVTAPVSLQSGDQKTELKAQDTVDESDRVITGNGGRAALKFAETSTITLGGNTELYIHSADPPDVGQGPVMRMQLEHGDLQVDAHGTDGALPQDFRINLGALSVRVLGGQIWATADAQGETLCLLEGATEISLGETNYRLDAAHDCLGHRSDTNEVQKVSSAPQVIDALLARTSFDAEPGLAAKALPVHLAMSGGTAAKPVAVKPTQTAPVTATAKPAAKPTGGWVVVVASLETAAAEKMKDRLAKEGLDAGLQTSAADPTRQQVVIGHYKSADEARKQVATLKHRYKGAWVTQRREN